jgi:hypothetical protein
MSTNNIKILPVDPSGTTTGGLPIVLPQKPARMRRFRTATWNQSQAIRSLCRHLRSKDTEGQEASMRALDRLHCWRRAVDSLMTGPSPNIAKGQVLLSFWLTYGLRIIPTGLKEDMPHLFDAFKYLFPPYPGEDLTLYRSELESRHSKGVYGISWTPILEKAKQLANRRSRIEGRGVVLKIEATPNMIAIRVNDYSDRAATREEDEHLVDPRMIHGKVSIVI